MDKIRCVYILYHNNEVVFVGQAENLFLRLMNKMKLDWDEYEYIEFEESTSEMDDLQAKLIVQHRPRHNKELPRNNYYVSESYLSLMITANTKAFKYNKLKSFLNFANITEEIRVGDTIYYDFIKAKKGFEELYKIEKPNEILSF